jgi:hypothetical protein
MENYIEKILCIEVLEKISRLKRYLQSHYSSSKTEGKEVVGLFMNALESTQNNLETVIIYLKKTSSLNYSEKASVLRRISNAFLTIVNLHDQLQLVYGSWVRPETYTFINEVLDFFPPERKPKKVNIVLTNEYNFLEGNLTWLFADILSNNNISIQLKEENPTIFLPKIDYDNPLNWAILAHECGHTDTKGIEDLLNNPQIIPNGISEQNKIILQSWVEEIYCDLIASRVLGPAYLASFCTYALLEAGIDGNEKNYKSHPANIVRISIIQEYLENMNIIVPLNKALLGCSDIGSYYYNMLEKYNEISRKFLNSYSSSDSLPFDLTELIDTISEQVDNIVKLKISLTNDDFLRIKILKERLSNGITIASYQDLEKLKKAKKNYPEKNVTIEELNTAKDALQETRTKLWEIINAGWLNKIECLFPKSIELFFSGEDDSSLNKKIESFSNELENYDNVLLKSIESSEIFKIMEESEYGTI